MGRTLSELLKLVKDSESFRDQVFKSRAMRNIAWYNGNYNYKTNESKLYPAVKLDMNDLYYSVNLVYSTTRTIVSSIYNRNPSFSFFIKGDIQKSIMEDYGIEMLPLQTEKLEKLTEAVVKTYFREMQSWRTNRMVVTDAILMGYGVSKMGYNVNFNKDVADQVRANMELPEDKFVELATNIEKSDLVKNTQPWLVRIHPLHMLFPVDSTTFNRLPWQAEILYKDADDVEKQYGMKKGSLPRSYVDDVLKELYPKKEQYANKIKLYEFHDIDSDDPRIYVFTEGYDKFLVDKPHPLFNKQTGQVKNMYQYMWFNESYCGIYPNSDIDLVASQISEANIQIERRVELIRKFVRMYIMSGVFDDGEDLKLMTGKDGTVIKSMDKDGSVGPIQPLEIGTDFYNNISMIRNEIYEVLGLTDYSVGGYTQERKATEAQYMERSRLSRVQERVDIIESYVYEQADTFVEIMKEYEQVGRMFRLQIDDERLNMMFTGELLKMADIDIQVVPGSTISFDRDIEISRLERIIPVLSQANAGDPGKVKIMKLVKDWLVKAGFSNASKYIIDEEAVMPVPGVDGRTPRIPGNVSQPGAQTATPDQYGQMPGTPGMPQGGV